MCVGERERERVPGTTGVCVHEYLFWIIVPVCSVVYAKCYDYVMWTDF